MKTKKGSHKRTLAARTKPHLSRDMPKRRLKVIQDAGSAPRLAWNDPVFTPVWQNDLALAAANTALEILQNSPDLEHLVALARKLLNAQSALAEGLINRATAGPVACDNGCDACCHQIIGATPLEVLAIFDHLKSGRKDLEALRQRAQLLGDAARTVSPAGRFAREHPCVFLEDHRCSIYEVRPLICRGINALDRANCETLLDDPVERGARWQRGEGSAGYLEPVHAAHALSAGLQITLFELYALTMHPLDLTLAMDHLLNREPNALTSWLQGEDPLFAVRGAHDSANPERLRSVGVNL